MFLKLITHILTWLSAVRKMLTFLMFPQGDINLQVQIVWFILSDDIKSKETRLHRPVDQPLKGQSAALLCTWPCLTANPLESDHFTPQCHNNPIGRREHMLCAPEAMQANGREILIKNLSMSVQTTQCIFCPQLPLSFQVKVSFCLLVLKIPSMGVEICLSIYQFYIFF